MGVPRREDFKSSASAIPPRSPPLSIAHYKPSGSKLPRQPITGTRPSIEFEAFPGLDINSPAAPTPGRASAGSWVITQHLHGHVKCSDCDARYLYSGAQLQTYILTRHKSKTPPPVALHGLVRRPVVTRWYF
jgi:hypothetical protein